MLHSKQSMRLPPYNLQSEFAVSRITYSYNFNHVGPDSTTGSIGKLLANSADAGTSTGDEILILPFLWKFVALDSVCGKLSICPCTAL